MTCDSSNGVLTNRWRQVLWCYDSVLVDLSVAWFGTWTLLIDSTAACLGRQPFTSVFARDCLANFWLVTESMAPCQQGCLTDC